MALTTDQIFKLGAESLGWNNSTAEDKAVIAEDMKLLEQLQLAHPPATSTNWTGQGSDLGQNLY